MTDESTGHTSLEPQVRLWPNPSPLECGVIAPYDRSTGGGKFSAHSLKKILTYARSKGKHAYPWLSYSVWAHIARSKLSLSEELAWLYFETFDVVSDVAASERLKLLEMTSKCVSDEELDQLRKRISVDTVKFILFLFVQNAPRMSLKAPLITGDEWPSPESDRKLKSSEYAHVSFLKSSISDLLHVVAEPSDEEVVTMEVLRCLGMLFHGCTRDRTTVIPLADLASLPSESRTSGFSKITGSFSRSQLEHWLRARLSINPFGPHVVKVGGASDKVCPCYRSDTYGKIVTNALSAPQGNRCLVLNRITKQTLAKGEEGLAGGYVHIQNCRGSCIYLLAPLRLVTVEKCSHCVLVLGAVETVVCVNNCDSVTVITACRRLHVSASSFCTFHLLSATRPVIFPSSTHLTLAPYNSHYPLLLSHMYQCGLLPSVNCWDQPVCLGAGADKSGIWQPMPPEQFRPVSVPFKMDGDTEEVPCSLPQRYQEALDKRKERTREWYRLMREAELAQEQIQQLQSRVQRKFQEWLQATGHKKEIVDLETPKSKTKTK